jgi:nucleoside 2-deoxyribosyltransferase
MFLPLAMELSPLMTLKVYLAGPEVFLANAREQLDRKIALTRAAGFEPIAPGDLTIPPQPTKRLVGHAISAVDEAMMDGADAIIANLTPYRGVSADTGTCFELGYMCAKGKLAYGYTNVAPDLRARLIGYYGGDVYTDEAGLLRGPDGLTIDDVDMSDSLMMQGGIERRGGSVVVHDATPENRFTDTTAFEACLKLLAHRAWTMGLA